MKFIKIILVATAASLFLYQNSHSQDSAAVNPGPQIQKILDAHNVPGAAVALVSKDSLIRMETFGKADITNDTPVTKHTLFGIGSISKTFVSMAALIAQEKGLLAIHHPIKQMLPSVPVTNRWSVNHPVRLVHLLEHTSGFDEAHFNIFSQADSSTPFSEVMNLSREALSSRWQPGTYYAYNNLGAALAAYGIEEQVNEPFEEFVAQHILSPLEMDAATYHPPKTDMAVGYAGTDYTAEPFPSLPQWPAGSLVASIEDMSAVVRMFLNSGNFKGRPILSASSVEKMETPETSLRAQHGIQYGYGKGLRGTFENGHLFYGHDGSYGGFLSEFGYSRKLDIGYVILINNRDANDAINAIKRALFKNAVPENPATLPASKPDIEVLQSITGCYQPITSTAEITHFVMRLIDLQCMIEEDGRLYQKSIIGDKQPLIHVQNNRFRRAGEPMTTSVFLKSENGSREWLDETAYQQIPAWWAYTQFFTAAACVLIIVLAFVTLVFWIPIRLIKKKTNHLRLQLLLFIAACSFFGMTISIATLYDPVELYSTGAVLFFIFGWLFLLLSFVALFQIIRMVYQKTTVNAWIKYHTLFTSTACCIAASYLLYWGIIGLRLWSY